MQGGGAAGQARISAVLAYLHSWIEEPPHAGTQLGTSFILPAVDRFTRLAFGAIGAGLTRVVAYLAKRC